MAARKPAPKPAEPETVAETVEDICRACWPNGWPHLHHSAQCEHGSYSRDPEVAPPEQPAATEPAADAETAETTESPTGDETGA